GGENVLVLLEGDPDHSLAGGDGWLIDVAIKVIEARETLSGICAADDEHFIGVVIDVADKEVAKFVEGGAGIAAGGDETVKAIGDRRLAPVRAAIAGTGGEQSIAFIDIGDDENAIGVGGIDGHSTFGLAAAHFAEVDVEGHGQKLPFFQRLHGKQTAHSGILAVRSGVVPAGLFWRIVKY